MLHISKTLKIQMGDEVIISLNDHQIHGTVINSGEGELDPYTPEYLLGAFYYIWSFGMEADNNFATGYALIEAIICYLSMIGAFPKTNSLAKTGASGSGTLEIVSILSGKDSYKLIVVLK